MGQQGSTNGAGDGTDGTRAPPCSTAPRMSARNTSALAQTALGVRAPAVSAPPRRNTYRPVSFHSCHSPNGQCDDAWGMDSIRRGDAMSPHTHPLAARIGLQAVSLPPSVSALVMSAIPPHALDCPTCYPLVWHCARFPMMARCRRAHAFLIPLSLKSHPRTLPNHAPCLRLQQRRNRERICKGVVFLRTLRTVPTGVGGHDTLAHLCGVRTPSLPHVCVYNLC